MTAMDERHTSRSVAAAGIIAVALVGAAVIAASFHADAESPGNPQETLLRATNQLAATDGFTATTEYTPNTSRESTFSEIMEFDGAMARVRWDWDRENCSLSALDDHWLGRFGAAIDGWDAPDAEPRNFRWTEPGPRIEFDYLDLSVDSRITVHAAAWIDLENGRLVRIERDISDEIGFQGIAVTTFDHDPELTCP